MKAEISSHYKRFNMRISIWQLIKFQPINARLVKPRGSIYSRAIREQTIGPNVLFIYCLPYLLNSFCLQGSLALGRLVSIPIALFLSPAIMLLVDLVG